jgi:hypothetical protein
MRGLLLLCGIVLVVGCAGAPAMRVSRDECLVLDQPKEVVVVGKLCEAQRLYK